jgi:PhzF family phenazine biosynthesis protein
LCQKYGIAFDRRPSAIEHGDEQWYDLERDIIRPSSSQKTQYPFCGIVNAFGNMHHAVAVASTGNPAGVVILEHPPRSNEWMQMVAQLLQQAETAFVWPHRDDKEIEEEEEEDQYAEGDTYPFSSATSTATTSTTEDTKSLPTRPPPQYNIRYFTPTVEVSLCGHATLASAAFLHEHGKIAHKDDVLFHATHDVLTATIITSKEKNPKSGNGTSVINVTMTFPSKQVTPCTCEQEISSIQNMLRSAFQVQTEDILFIGHSKGLGDLLVEITYSSFDTIGYAIDTQPLLEYDGYTRGIILCSCRPDASSASDNDDDFTNENEMVFYSRFFAPKAGIDEDHVTGSAHCALAPYFSARFSHRPSTTAPVKILRGIQRSLRGGVVDCEIGPNDTVKLTGVALTAVSGSLRI